VPRQRSIVGTVFGGRSLSRREAQGEARAGPDAQPPVPQGAAHPRQGGRRGGTEGGSRGRAGAGEGRVDRALRRGFPGWQGTKAGEREVQKALRKVVYVDYKIKDQDLFDRAFGYVRQYY